MSLPLNPHSWPEPWAHALRERAAIMEFEAHMPQEQAERAAEADVRRCEEREAK